MSQSKSPPEHLQGRNEGHVPWLLRRIWDKVNRKNEHFMGCIVGEEGSGKSLTAIRIAEEVDPTFSADRVIFDVIELLKILRDGDHEPGQFYVLDEAGVQLGNRTWQDRSQILANQALQLIRDHNLGLLFTIPRLSEMDSQSEGRIQAVLELTDKEDGEYVAGKWFFRDPDRRNNSGKVYEWMPRRYVDGRMVKIKEVAFRPPSPELVEPYEAAKDEFQEDFYTKTIEHAEGDDTDDEDENMQPSEVAEEVAGDRLEDFVSIHGQHNTPYLDKELIRIEYGLSHADANAVKSLAKKQLDDADLEAAI